MKSLKKGGALLTGLAIPLLIAVGCAEGDGAEGLVAPDGIVPQFLLVSGAGSEFLAGTQVQTGASQNDLISTQPTRKPE